MSHQKMDPHLAVEFGLSKLRPREAEVIQRRFGFESHPETLRSIADSWGVSPGRILQIEGKAIARLRRALVIYRFLCDLGLAE